MFKASVCHCWQWVCLCQCVLLEGLHSCKMSALKKSLKARRGCHPIINTCSLCSILHTLSHQMCKSGHLHSFHQISARNVRCYSSGEALEFSFHSVWVMEACAKPLSWSAGLFFFFLCMVNICIHFYKHMPFPVKSTNPQLCFKMVQGEWREGPILSVSVSDAPLSPHCRQNV